MKEVDDVSGDRVINGVDSEKRKHRLSFLWLEQKFKVSATTLYEKILNADTGVYHLPLTNKAMYSSKRKERKLLPLDISVTTLQLKYPQGENSYCLTCSVASCLHAIGDEEAARIVYSVSDQYLSSTIVHEKRLKFMVNLLNQQLKDKTDKKIKHYNCGSWKKMYTQ